jgi:hypothetical protein
LPDLLHIVRDMPRGDELGGLEAGFLSTIDAAIRGDRLKAAIQDGWCRIVADDHCRVSACPRWGLLFDCCGRIVKLSMEKRQERLGDRDDAWR